MEYTVIIDKNHGKFIARVNEAIRHGWKPQGGIFYWESGASGGYCQAMIRLATQE